MTFDDPASESTGFSYAVVASNAAGRAQSSLVTVTGLTRTVTVTNAGTGSGTVTSSPAGIDCGSTCSAPFADGTSVTLTAVAASGSTFTGWSGGGCSGTGGCQVTISANTAVTATFAAKPEPPACVVPNVRGKALVPAKKAIQSHDCSVGKISHAISRTIKKDRVISQKPKPGSRLNHGAKVSLVVSKGR